MKRSAVAREVSALIQELVAAALCFGATHHKAYEAPGLAALRRRTRGRLDRAAKLYHGKVMAISFLSQA